MATNICTNYWHKFMSIIYTDISSYIIMYRSWGCSGGRSWHLLHWGVTYPDVSSSIVVVALASKKDHHNLSTSVSASKKDCPDINTSVGAKNCRTRFELLGASTRPRKTCPSQKMSTRMWMKRTRMWQVE